MRQTDILEVLQHFEGVKRCGDGQYMARCPCHDDRKQSLSIGRGEKGVVLKCQVGCDTHDIIARVGIKPRDLFYDAEAKPTERPQIVAVYEYPNGVQKLRKSDKSFSWRRPDGKGGWIYNRQGVPHSLYVAGSLGNQRIHYEEKGGYLMPKKKTIPPPDDFSSEFMETESAKELSEQQVEAAGSDNTETPLAEPPEVDLGSGDVSGTTDVEENELDAENTADAAEIVPVSDEKAEDPEYDSILQELNSSTPAPLDSSGENSLDALLLEGNVENAPPAEDETESADGEAAPQPTAPPAPAGRRDSYILTVDAKDRIETEEERREVIWHEIKTSHIAGRILTGTLDGVEQTPSGRTIVVVDYKGYRIAIPLKEMMLYSGPVPYGAKYKPFMERMNSILATMLTAEIDFIVRGLDNTARSVVASRKAAMLRKRQTFYLDTNEDGVPMIYEGRVVQARVIGVAEKVLRVEVFGVECTIFARDLSAAWFGDAREYYSVGDRVLVRVLTIDRDDINHISITADIRSVSSAANQSNLDKCVLQGKYAGRVTDVRHGVVFIRLNNGVNAVAHTCYDRRMPGKKDDISFAVTRLDEERSIAVGIITRIIKQNL